MKKVLSFLLTLLIVGNISVRSSATSESESIGRSDAECHTTDAFTDGNITESVINDL